MSFIDLVVDTSGALAELLQLSSSICLYLGASSGKALLLEMLGSTFGINKTHL